MFSPVVFVGPGQRWKVLRSTVTDSLCLCVQMFSKFLFHFVDKLEFNVHFGLEISLFISPQTMKTFFFYHVLGIKYEIRL